MAICNQINHVLCTRAWFFFKSLNLNFSLRVLHYSKLFLIVKKITDLSTVNFEKTHCKCGTACAWSHDPNVVATTYHQAKKGKYQTPRPKSTRSPTQAPGANPQRPKGKGKAKERAKAKARAKASNPKDWFQEPQPLSMPPKCRLMALPRH